MLLKSILSGISRTVNVLLHTLRFAVHGEHPRHKAIALAYLRLRLWVHVFRRPLHSTSLLGHEVRFPDARTFLSSFYELFVEESYREVEGCPARIVDCGSNIGMSILWFKSLWPDSRIIGVEASPHTFAILRQNVASFSNVSVINKAVSDRHGQIGFYSGGNSLLSSTNPLRGGDHETVVEAVPLSELVNASVDLLKVDIEGAEEEAFAELESSGKMSLIKQMLIEYHHHLPGNRARFSGFLARLERTGFEYELAARMPARFGEAQDILIRARRNSAKGVAN